MPGLEMSMFLRARRRCFFFALACAVIGTPGTASAARPIAYVWLFSSDGPDAKEIAEKVTDEFEVALLEAGCASLVERREIKKLFDHQKNELAISSVSSLAAADRAELQARRADSVVFGRISDDFESGHIRIEVKLQTLTGETLAGKRVLLTKGKRLDAVDREEMMQKLAEDLCRSVGKAMGPAGAEPLTSTGSAEVDPLAARAADLAQNDGASVLLPDQVAKGKLAKGTVKKYYFSGKSNTPLHLSVSSKGSSFWTSLQILDAQGRELKSPTGAYHSYEMGFTPPRDGVYVVRLAGEDGFGEFTLLLRRLEDLPIP